MAAPVVVEEGGLVDDVGAGLHGDEGLGLGVGERGDGVVGVLDLDDVQAFVAVAGELLLLVLAAAAGEDVEHGVVLLGALTFAAEDRELELGEVLARGVAGEVARAQRERAVVEKVHPATPPP